MKKVLVLAIMGLLITLLAGCGSTLDTGAAQGREELIAKEKIKIGLENSPDPEGVSAWAEEIKIHRGAYIRTFAEERVLVVAMGEQSTGGYDVEIVDACLNEQGDNWTVEVIFKSPSEGAVVIEALTYPYEVLTLPADGRQVAVYILDAESKEIKEELKMQESRV